MRSHLLAYCLIAISAQFAACAPATAPVTCAGTPTGALYGKITGPFMSGIAKPVAGVVVSLQTDEQLCLTKLSTTSNQDGVFVILQVPATATYTLAITPPGDLMLAPGQPIPNSIHVTTRSTVTVNVKLYFTPRDTLLTFYVGPREVECFGFIPQKCLLVKDRPEAEYTWFSDPIEGFTFEPNYEYTLKVIRRHRPKTMADQGTLTWHLVEVSAKKPVG
jgi:hypothetical protein